MKAVVYAALLTILLPQPQLAAASPACALFEVKLEAIDADGTHHAISNSQQGLKWGQAWQSASPISSGVEHISVSWRTEAGVTEPLITVAVAPPGADVSRALGTAVLERLVWEYLYGPEPLLTKAGKPLVLPNLGALFAVAAVGPVDCANPTPQ